MWEYAFLSISASILCNYSFNHLFYLEITIHNNQPTSATDVTTLDTGFSCLPSFTLRQTGCYHVGPNDMQWHEAEDYCTNLNAHLAKPDTKEVTITQKLESI